METTLISTLVLLMLTLSSFSRTLIPNSFFPSPSAPPPPPPPSPSPFCRCCSAEVEASFLRLLHKIFTLYPTHHITPTFLDESGYLQTLLDNVHFGLTEPMTNLASHFGNRSSSNGHSRGGNVAAAVAKEIRPLMFALQCVNCMCLAQPQLVEVFGLSLLKNAHYLLAEHVAKSVRRNTSLSSNSDYRQLTLHVSHVFHSRLSGGSYCLQPASSQRHRA